MFIILTWNEGNEIEARTIKHIFASYRKASDWIWDNEDEIDDIFKIIDLVD